MNKNQLMTVIFVYFILSIAMTYPLIINFFDSIVFGGDAVLYLWNFWWIKKALIELAVNPFYTHYLFYPSGLNLAYSGLTLPNSLTAIPLMELIGFNAAFNFLSIASLALSALGAYLLTYYLTGNKKASFIAGLIFGFCPYHFVHFSHLNLAPQWIPFYVLFLFKTFKEKSYWNPFIAALFFTLNCITDWYYASFLLLFTVLMIPFFLIYYYFDNKEIILGKPFLKRIALMIALFILTVMPFALPLIQAGSSYDYSVRSIDSSVAHSIDLMAFIVPSYQHSLLGSMVEPFYEHIHDYNGFSYGNNIESTGFIGYTVIALTLFCLIKVKNKEKKFWRAMALIFLVLSLGPALHMNGLVQIPVQGIGLDKLAERIEPDLNPNALKLLESSAGIPLPYMAWHFIPFLNSARVPARFTIMLMLCLSVLSAMALKEIFIKRKSSALFIGLSLLVLFEYSVIPLQLQEPVIPSVYEIIKNDEEEFALIEVPLCNGLENCVTRATKNEMFYQVFHEKPIVTGLASRIPRESFEFIESSPFLNALSNLSEFNESNTFIDKGFLKENKLKYVIVHRNFFEEFSLTDKDYNELIVFLEKHFVIVFQDNELTAFKVY